MHLRTDLLPVGTVVEIETGSRTYRLETAADGSVLISGHPEYCPTPVSVKLHGGVDKHGVLEPGQIGRGMRLMFFIDGNRPVTTSRIVDFRVGRAGTEPRTVH